jgi:hypothetical protein
MPAVTMRERLRTINTDAVGLSTLLRAAGLRGIDADGRAVRRMLSGENPVFPDVAAEVERLAANGAAVVQSHEDVARETTAAFERAHQAQVVRSHTARNRTEAMLRRLTAPR